MRLHRLRLQNFRQHEATELHFDAGLTGIIGPNGAGKTTILEAIAWAMYGMGAARGTKDSIRRRGAPPRAKVEVELEFTLGAHSYRLERSLNAASLYQDGETAAIANSQGAVTERVTRLLGMSRDEFFNTYFTGQKELAVMGQSGPTERAQFLSRVLGYERLRTAQDRLRERRATLKATLEALRSGLPPADVVARELADAVARREEADRRLAASRAALATAEATAAEVRPRWEAAQRAREAAAQLEAEARVAEQEAQSAREAAARAEAERRRAADAAERLARLQAELAPLEALRAEARALEEAAQAEAAQAGRAAQRRELEARIEQLRPQLAAAPAPQALAAAEARQARVREALDFTRREAEARRTQWVEDKQEAKTKRDGLADQYRDLKEQRDRIAAAGASGPCPTCGRPLEHAEQVLAILDRQLEEVTLNGGYYRQKLDRLREPPADLAALQAQETELAAGLQEATVAVTQVAAALEQARRLAEEQRRLEERLAALRAAEGPAPAAAYDPARHDAVRAAVRRLEPLALEAAGHRALAERAPALAAEVGAAEARRAASSAAAATARERRSAIDFRPEAHAALQAEDLAAQRARQDAALALARAEGDAASAAEGAAQAERRREERERREAEARAVQRELLLAQELDRALGDLRTDLNQALRPDLSELASGFLRDLTISRYTDLELDEDYVATLVDDGEPKGVISGGEEDVANLALRLAISQMIAERAGQPLSLLVLDEIFGSLDEERRGAVVELLRSLADRFPQVILITHIDSVRDGFDRIIRVSFDPRRGVASAEEERRHGDVAA